MSNSERAAAQPKLHWARPLSPAAAVALMAGLLVTDRLENTNTTVCGDDNAVGLPLLPQPVGLHAMDTTQLHC